MSRAFDLVGCFRLGCGVSPGGDSLPAAIRSETRQEGARPARLRRYDGEDMQIYSWDSPFGNVGDDLNDWLWPRLLGGDFFDGADAEIFCGIGTLIEPKHLHRGRRYVIAGAGAADPAVLDALEGVDLEVRFVRGPKSAAALGLAAERGISDPAILMPLYAPGDGGRPAAVASDAKIGFVPHWKTNEIIARLFAEAAGLRLISPTATPERFVRALLKCDALVCESMHGAILADCYRRPWFSVNLSVHRNHDAYEFKWQDWLSTVELAFHRRDYLNDLEYFPVGRNFLRSVSAFFKVTGAGRQLRRALRSDGWQLSDPGVLAQRQAQILAALDDLAKDRGGDAGLEARRRLEAAKTRLSP